MRFFHFPQVSGLHFPVVVYFTSIAPKLCCGSKKNLCKKLSQILPKLISRPRRPCPFSLFVKFAEHKRKPYARRQNPMQRIRFYLPYFISRICASSCYLPLKIKILTIPIRDDFKKSVRVAADLIIYIININVKEKHTIMFL